MLTREWKLMLENEGISEKRYLQLKWLARQYGELKQQEARFRRGEVDRLSGSGEWNGAPDPTGNAGARLASSPYAWKISAIEQAAIAADPALSPWLLKNVTDGIRLEHLDVPCGRNQFFAARRKFFVELDCRVP